MKVARRMWLGVVALTLLWGAVLGWRVGSSKAAPLPQIVQPGDVTTPTATFTIILVPTATATPVPPLSVVDSTLGESLNEPIGVHGEEAFASFTVRPGDTLLVVALEVGVDV